MAWWQYSSGSDLPSVPAKPADWRAPTAGLFWLAMVGLLIAAIVTIVAGWGLNVAGWCLGGAFICYVAGRLLLGE